MDDMHTGINSGNHGKVIIARAAAHEWRLMRMIEYETQEMQMIPYKDRRKIEKKVLPEYYKGIRTHKKMF